MALEILSVDEMYRDVSDYCIKKICPKLSEDRKGNCDIKRLCSEPIVVPNDSRLLNIVGLELEIAYEIVTGKRKYSK